MKLLCASNCPINTTMKPIVLPGECNFYTLYFGYNSFFYIHILMVLGVIKDCEMIYLN